MRVLSGSTGRIRWRHVGVVVLLLAFTGALLVFVNDYSTDSDTADDNAGGPRSPGSGSASAGLGSPSPSAGIVRGPGNGLTALPTALPTLTVNPAEPGGFVYKDLPVHVVTLSVSSPAEITGLGYLVPRSQDDHYYDRVSAPGKSWSLTTNAIGKPYYAALFIRGPRIGAPVTCTIDVDGKQVSSLTTKGPFGTRVCLG